MNPIPITAIVVSCDEGHLLKRCLNSLTFCDEIIVVDMDCTDQTVSIAAQFKARVFKHQRVPFVEAAQKWMSTLASHDWIINIDPDEVFDPKLASALVTIVNELPEDVAVIEFPIQFYLGNHALRGTYWGGKKWKPGSFFHRQRVTLGAVVHRRAEPNLGLRIHRIPWQDDQVLHHYWMLNYAQLIEKHLRYIQAEGLKHQAAGQTFSWLTLSYETAHAFAWSLIKKSAWKDGLTGIGLSIFYAWYVASGWLALRSLNKKA
jgi:glycosyltransferase involved in cell wall biosynthesis